MLFSANIIEEEIQGKYLTSQISGNAGRNSNRLRTERLGVLQDPILLSLLL